MKTEYNEVAFTPEEVERGMHLDLINYLLDYSEKAQKRYNDIHITTDGYCTLVQWNDVDYDEEYESGKFEFVDYDEVVAKDYMLPDNSSVLCRNEEECKEVLDEFLKKYPNYKQNQYGMWYEEDLKNNEE